MEFKPLGEKIRHFRKRANLSQMSLELMIGTSYGSISRIENNEVNPTKETLLKIIEALNLPVHDAANLMGIELERFFSMLDVIKILNSTLNFDELLQNSVNVITNKFDLYGAGITLVDGNYLVGKTISQTKYTKLILDILPKPIYKVKFNISNNENLLTKTLIDDKIYYSNNISDFLSPTLSKRICIILKNVANIKSCISLPIYYNNTPLGVIFFCKKTNEDFSMELPLLKEYTEHIGIAIMNAKKYKNVENELKKLKSKDLPHSLSLFQK